MENPEQAQDPEQAEDREQGDRAPESKREALVSYVAAREELLADSITAALDLPEVPEPRADLTATVIALIEGLTLSACLGRLTPEEATRLAIDHVLGLRPHALAATGASEPPTTSG